MALSKDLRVKSPITAEPVARYVVERITRDSAIEAGLRIATTELENGGMISSSDVGALLTLLAQSIGSRRAIEIGTFTGYTALKIAQALPSGGILVCCDVSHEWPQIGRSFWEKAGVSKRIDLRIGPALSTLTSLLNDGNDGLFDFAFIDADKLSYDAYYEICLQLVRPGGLIVLDNMLWSGKVADPSIQDETTISIRNLNEKISSDKRVFSCLLTVGDGLMVARKL